MTYEKKKRKRDQEKKNSHVRSLVYVSLSDFTGTCFVKRVHTRTHARALTLTLSPTRPHTQLYSAHPDAFYHPHI